MEFKVFFIKVLSDQSRVLTQTAKGIEKTFKRSFKELDSDRQERSARQCKERLSGKLSGRNTMWTNMLEEHKIFSETGQCLGWEPRGHAK